MMMCGLWLMSCGRRCRQGDGKGRALAGSRTVGGDLAAMHIDDALDDGKPQTGRTLAGGRFRREPLEAAEQPPEVFRRQAGAFVGDADDSAVVVVGDQQRDLP